MCNLAIVATLLLIKPLRQFLLLSVLICGYSQVVLSQAERSVEELNALLSDPQSADTSLARAYVDLSEKLFIENFDTLIPLCNKASEVAINGLNQNPNSAERRSFLITLATANNNEGYAHSEMGDTEAALVFYSTALSIQKEIYDWPGIGTTYNNIGYVYQQQGLIVEALKNYHISAEIQEKLADADISITYNNLGIMYKQQGDFDRSLEYYEESLQIRKSENDKNGMANSYNNIGKLYQEQGELEIALMYFKKALVIREEIKHKRGLANSYSSIADILFETGQEEEAFEYVVKSIEIGSELANSSSLCHSYNLLAEIYIERGDLVGAERVSTKSFKLAEELGYPRFISEASLLLSDINERKGNNAAALQFYKTHITMRDSLVNTETQEMFAQTKVKYEYDQQKAIDDNNHRNEIVLEQEINARQQYIISAIIFCIVILVVFLIFVFTRLRITTRQKRKIGEQKDEIQNKSREILDSITYAKRIQSAILPNAAIVDKLLGDSFILYKPKDIVAGDFYWLDEADGKVLFAAADCTGHGVPGAMVSVVCSNALNRSVREGGLTDPGLILNHTRDIVTAELDNSSERVRDGMDIALCAIDGEKLWYAGANNPLWLVRNGALQEIKADKQPIGNFERQWPFKTHEVNLEKGDVIYIFSDGYADQFGGPKRKKFKSKAFRELLLTLQDFDMETQALKLEEAFEAWRGSNEQLDDVCVIGVKI
jgi:serine phosphatase RsbU (regulator of sigma subunit)/uncharacterized protein HemY